MNTRGVTVTRSCPLASLAIAGRLKPTSRGAGLETGHATADADAPSEMGNRTTLEAIIAPAMPSRIGSLILIDFSFLGSDEWRGDDAEERNHY
jgi:hypothetical protein